MEEGAVKGMKKNIEAMEWYSRISTLEDLTIDELFYPKFMNQHTYSKTIKVFLVKGNFEVKCVEDFNKIPKEKLDEFVFAQTGQFKTFDEFLTAARLFWLENHI